MNRRTGRHCRPVLQLPTGQFSQLANCCVDPGAHGLNRGQSKMNRTGANEEKGSGHGMAKVTRQANIACRTRPLQADTAGRQSARHRPQKNNGQQMAGLAEEQQPPTKLAGLSPCSAGKWREYGGAGPQKAGSDRPDRLSPSHLSPLPVTVPTHSLNFEKPNLAPT